MLDDWYNDCQKGNCVMVFLEDRSEITVMRIIENGTKHMLCRFSQFSIFSIKMRTNKFSMLLLL